MLENFKISAKTIYKILIYWCNGLIQKNILRFVDTGRNTLSVFRKLLLSKIDTYFINNPIMLGCVGSIVNIDETMIDHKVKAHHGKAPHNKT
ncbi:hypothetical protein H311_01908 [Anncaliia algerae PRA109]|nr:hypothetical protein H311_01908 [Anncaliia algerae PRA109]